MPPSATISKTAAGDKDLSPSPFKGKNGCVRLYQNGMATKQRHEAAFQEGQANRTKAELDQCLEVPRISDISIAVAQQLPSHKKRHKGAHFSKYSDEWKKMRDSKIEEARKRRQQQESQEFYKPKINPYNLPPDYKGPITGY